MKASKSLLARLHKLENENSSDIILTLNDGDTVVVKRNSALQFCASALNDGDDNEVEQIVRNIVSVHEPDSRLMEILIAVLN
jgi:hypothetical protein